MAAVEIVPFDPARHHHLLPSIVTLHIDTIEQDDIPLRFHAPFTAEKREKMTAFWEKHAQQVAEGQRITLVALAGPNGDESSVGTNNDGSRTRAQDARVLGVVELALSDTETGAFRAEMEMLIVSPSYRRRGLATSPAATTTPATSLHPTLYPDLTPAKRP
ncbi:hypothetical protein E4U53_002069 [Claviceps sorghi]|nr:hypothetical protein E4U53_002069 [Claviceps sorghi]